MYHKNLVEVIKHKIGSEEVNAVNARDLWVELESKRQFSDWIKSRIEDYGFTQGIDFSIIHKTVNKEIGIGSGRKPVEYIISLDMAKELAMVERTEKGKVARRYFIECEKRARAADNDLQAYVTLFRKHMMLDVPMVWEKIYPDSFFIALMRLHGQEFKGNSSTPQYCANIIGNWIYDVVLPAQIRKEINSSKGAEKRHQWFSQQGGRKILSDQINRIEIIANCSSSRADFEANCRKNFSKETQLKITMS